MADQIVSFVEDTQKNPKIASLDVAAVKQTVVMKLLFLLGWDIFNPDEVSPDYPVGKDTADYTLRVGEDGKLLILVCKSADSPSELHAQLTRMASAGGPALALLTNGIHFEFYLTDEWTDPARNRLCDLDLQSQEAAEVAVQLSDGLEKKRIESGAALKQAKSIIAERHQEQIEKSLPEAWQRIVAEPHETLVDLLCQSAETVCGFVPDRKTAARFISDHVPAADFTTATSNKKIRRADAEPQEKKPVIETVPSKKALNLNGKPVTAFAFKGKTYRVNSWDQVVLKLCEVLLNEYHVDVEKLAWFSVGKKYYFSRDPDGLKMPEKILETDIYVQSNMSAKEAFTVSKAVLSFYGYSEDDFSIATKE